MLRALNTAATGMAAQQQNIDVVANNIANVNTTAFRRSRMEFQDLVYQTVRVAGGSIGNGAILPTGIQIGQGTRTAATQQVHTPGSLTQTGGPMDVAIEGNGFFQIMRPNGELAYTRAGNFKSDAEGHIITVDGYMLEPQVHLPTDVTGVTIAPDGTISVTTPSNPTAVELTRLQLANFVNPGGLQAIGRGLFVPTAASGQPLVETPGENGVGILTQGSLEKANVDVVTEMIDLITAQRAYEINHRVIQAGDDMLKKVTER